MFDAVSYNKGGRILHMLRNYIGDDAFFKSLNKYLSTNKFGTGSAHKLRLAFEEVTGKDLNWYWNQWYFGSGHPTLDISYFYNAENKFVSVYVKQTQSGDKVFKLPFAIDVYNGSKKTRYDVWMNNKIDTFSFATETKPDLINVDGDKILLATKKDAKTLSEFIHQYKYAGKYMDRKEALDFAGKKTKEATAINLLNDALNDPFAPLRVKAIQVLGNTDMDAATIAKLENIANRDANKLARAEAIEALSSLKNDKYKDLFIKGTSDSSYSVAGASLEALATLDSKAALDIALKLSKQTAKGKLSTAIAGVMVKYGNEDAYDFIAESFDKMPLSQAKFQALNSFADILVKVKTASKFKSGVDKIVAFRDAIPESVKGQTTPYINGTILKGIADKKQESGETELADYVKSKM